MAIDELQSRAHRSRFAAAASLHCSLPWSIGFGWNWGRNKTRIMLVVSGTGMTLLTFDLNRTFCYSIPRRPETLSLLVAIHCSQWQFKFSLMNVDSTLFSPTELHSVNFSNLCFAAEFIGLENYWETAIEHCVSISTHYWLFKFSKNVLKFNPQKFSHLDCLSPCASH